MTLIQEPNAINVSAEFPNFPSAGISKARMLESLANIVKKSHVLPMIRISAEKWTQDKESILQSIEKSNAFPTPYAVRSSAAREDSEHASHAGEFLSVLHVDGASLADAISRVVESFGALEVGDEVLIQPMAPDVACSGVVMTSDPRGGFPYVIVNFSVGSDTETITAGRAGVHTFVHVRGMKHVLPEMIQPLEPAIEELDRLFGGKPLDVEFGISNAGTIYLFQVRPIVMTHFPKNKKTQPHKLFKNTLYDIHGRISKSMEFSRRRLSVDPIFGVMPDWNPAEMIGLKPRPLSFSLYRHLITDRAWSRGRYRLGYRDLRYIPLMHAFGGTPFIDVGASITSFVPADVPDVTAQRIVLEALQQLKRNPDLHDKIEFGVVPTCYTPTIDLQAWREKFTALSLEEWQKYKSGLRNITNRMIEAGGIFDSRLPAIRHLRALVHQYPKPSHSDIRDVLEPLEMAYTYGTVLFAEVARMAFVATDILKSLVTCGALDQRAIDGVTYQADTIGSRLVADFAALDKSAFLARHGHIRPGTYDITVPRYDEDPDRYFNWDPGVPCTRSDPQPDIDLLSAHNMAVDVTGIFEEHGLSFDFPRFLTFAKASIRAREEVKYLFSRLVSDALQALERMGRHFELDREKLSFLTIQDLQKCLDLHGDQQAWLHREVAANMAAWEATLDIRVPDLITSADDIFGFEVMESQPTFVTNLTVEASVATVEASDLSGKIVFIESADPGFDWIFTRDIRGFVTAYGGENSHMSIRAREFNLPAVIGAGSRFERWRAARRLRLECSSRRVEVLS